MCHEELVWALISKYFVNLTSILVVHNSSLSSETSELYVQAAEASFQNLTQQGRIIALHWINVAELESQSALNALALENADLGVEGYITILVNVIGFLSARRYATERTVLRLKDKFYLFFIEDTNPKDILIQEVLMLYPHHLLVSSAKNGSNFELWTQKFVGLEDNLDPVHLDTFFVNGSFEKNVQLFPNKIVNMQGRKLPVATVTYVPYVVSYFVPNGTGDVDSLDPAQSSKNVIFIGNEAEAVRTFCDKLNCTIKLMPYGNDNWGGVYENGSSDGIIGSVYRKETELGIGCYYNWYNEIFETSIAIVKSSVPIMVPAPSLYPAYMTIILPFNKLIWSLILFTIFISSIVMHGIRYFSFLMINEPSAVINEKMYETNERINFEHMPSYMLTLFQMVAIFFQQSFTQSKLDRFASRFFLSTLLVAGLTLENTYSGQLKSLLTIPPVTDPVDTIHKFSRTNWKWAAASAAWINSIATSDVLFEKIMVEKFIVLSYEAMKNASFSGDIGIGIERLHGGSYSFGEFIRDGNLDHMIITKDDLYYDWTRAFTIRGWPLMDAFNSHISHCLDHGFFNYWERKYVYLFMDHKTQETIRNLASGRLRNYPPKPLTIANISGPLFALFIGYIVGFVVLLPEMIVGRIFGNKII